MKKTDLLKPLETALKQHFNTSCEVVFNRTQMHEIKEIREMACLFLLENSNASITGIATLTGISYGRARRALINARAKLKDKDYSNKFWAFANKQDLKNN